ncbi:SCO7613 C-terminal domain-containing membrane protein [Pimelobacter simplex]|uniref:SCO7613 C-terminal domain-containing membrane protein n=1 Tax=Nocardioides simplex TaxID=2045 RepID=UPI00214FC048|nr:hypothetical protein [Pimelobacter simplex]UUW87184.1 hypothetical protein M0M43_15680 [Pimelobacter simplex]UUW96690.1 hypothetical protein M0M48_04325 [Pimelobacter simplex]
MRYADPTLCPDCRADLPVGVRVCPTCDLLVRHSLAVDLFGTLGRADTLLAELRRASDTHRAATTGARPVAVSALGGPLVPPGQPVEPKRSTSIPAPPPPLPPYPAGPGAAATPPPPPAAAHSGVAFASVPKILLGLGAFCLLVAAIIFLAVSWSTLGVGGRTAVLAGFTLAAGTSALLLHRIGLRIAGESLVVVALGMLALDVVGAGAAGWFGDTADGTVACVAGLVTLVAGIALGLLRVGAQPRLVAPQVIAGIALVVAYGGAMVATDHHLVTGHALTAVGIGAVLVGRLQRTPALLWSAAAASGLVWLSTGTGGLLLALDEPTLRELWIEGTGWSLLVTAGLLLVPGLVARHHETLLAGASGAALVVTGIVTLPWADDGARTVGLIALAATTVWVLALALLPRSFRVVAIAPAGMGALILAGLAAGTSGTALDRWSRIAQGFEHPVGVRLDGPEPFTEPLLLVPSLLVVLACLVLLTPDRGRNAPRVWAEVAGLTVGLGAATTLASYDVALALPAGVLALTAIGAAGLALSASGPRAGVLAAAAATVAGGAALTATPSATLTLALAGALSAAMLALAVLGRDAGRRLVGGLAAVPLLALATAAGVHVAGGGTAWVAIPVLLAVGRLALALPRVEVEAAAIGAAIVTFPVSLVATADPGGYTSLWLTVAGFIVCATALLHESRRWCAIGGVVLLVLASWVRLADLDVHAPEPYTLPLAAGLVALGLWRMQRSPSVGTAEALLPGLLVGTVPSLLWVLGDPVSLRALVLGAACLALTVAGAALRWSAPLVTGATVGAIVVLREIGPYAGDFPKWVWIGLAGALLTVVGITWERRLLEVRQAVGFLGRLR